MLVASDFTSWASRKMSLTLAQFGASAVSMVNVMVNVYQVFFTSLSLKKVQFLNNKLQTETKTLTLIHLPQTEHNDNK